MATAINATPNSTSSKFLSLPKSLTRKSICKQHLYSINPKFSSFSSSIIITSKDCSLKLISPIASSSTSSAPTIEEGREEKGSDSLPSPPSDDAGPLSLSDSDAISFQRGCKACGKEEIERGCNGEGRIQGGIATVPGLGWWPIKAYRPCPAFVASGGRYRRSGQSMDEVAFGRGGKGASMETDDEAKSSKKKQGAR